MNDITRKQIGDCLVYWLGSSEINQPKKPAPTPDNPLLVVTDYVDFNQTSLVSVRANAVRINNRHWDLGIGTTTKWGCYDIPIIGGNKEQDYDNLVQEKLTPEQDRCFVTLPGEEYPDLLHLDHDSIQTVGYYAGSCQQLSSKTDGKKLVGLVKGLVRDLCDKR